MQTNTKSALRSRYRAARRTLSEQQRRDAGKLAANLLAEQPRWQQARHIAIYLPADGEMPTSAVESIARAAGKVVYLPVILPDNHLEFAQWNPDQALLENRYGIPEPPPSVERKNAQQLDCIILPLVAWDRRGVRLGMGGGFYDRSLEGTQGTLRVGLGYANQEVGCLPADRWDAPLDIVVTERELVHASDNPKSLSRR
jgi:5-formyltetrahydrofolate cyclo-ligase